MLEVLEPSHLTDVVEGRQIWQQLQDTFGLQIIRAKGHGFHND